MRWRKRQKRIGKRKINLATKVAEIIILVDENDNQVGTGEKMEVHRAGKLHRAFSVFVFNSRNEMLLQRRALTKYHSGGLWTNTCCSHPRPEEKTMDGAKRRLMEEMGFECELKEVDSFVYKTEFEGLFEHEHDHVLIGKYEGEIRENKDEVEEWKWVNRDELNIDVKNNSDKYTSWFKIALERLDFQELLAK